MGLISTGVSVLCLAAFVNVALIIFAGLKEKGKGLFKVASISTFFSAYFVCRSSV